MSHPNPSHDRKNEYPSDGYSSAKKKALGDKSKPSYGFPQGSLAAKQAQRADGGLEKPVKKMLDLSDIAGKVGAKAQAIKKKYGKDPSTGNYGSRKTTSSDYS